MKAKILGWTAIWLLGAVGAIAQAVPIPITYDLSFTNGSNSLSGTITTDGTIGAINAANITAWSFTQTGPLPFSISSVVAGDQSQCLQATTGCFTASPSSLSFKFESTVSNNPYAEFFDAENSVQFEEFAQFSAGIQTGQCAGLLGCTSQPYPPLSDVVGTAPVPVPVPAAIWLILSGLGGLGLTGWRRGQTAAV
jgi:hypothetical protein